MSVILASSAFFLLLVATQPSASDHQIRGARNPHPSANPFSSRTYYKPSNHLPNSIIDVRQTEKLPHRSPHQRAPVALQHNDKRYDLYPSTSYAISGWSEPHNYLGQVKSTATNTHQSASRIVHPKLPNIRFVPSTGVYTIETSNDYDTNLHFNSQNYYDNFQRIHMSDIDPVNIRPNRAIDRLDFIQTKIIGPLKRPSNVSRVESPFYPWGNHAFGPLSSYQVTPRGTRYNAYFYDQAIAVVLEDSKRTVLNCTLLEIIPEHEQRVALRSLGQVMALVPLTLRQMVLLNTYCKSSKERRAPRPNSKRIIGEKNIKPERLVMHASTALMGLLPGTVWCGLGDRARIYHQLGERPELDSCCRTHDHCPVKLRAGATRYGNTNNAFATVSHCLCDEAFRVCLQEAAQYDDLAPVVGNLFFNIIRPQCLAQPKKRSDGGDPQTPITKTRGRGHGAIATAPEQDIYKPRLECTITDSENGCRMWTRNPKSIPLKLDIISPNFRFKKD